MDGPVLHNPVILAHGHKMFPADPAENVRKNGLESHFLTLFVYKLLRGIVLQTT